MELDALVDHPAGHLGRPPLGGGRVLGGQSALVQGQHAPVDVDLGDVDLRLDLGQPEAGVLERADRPAEGGPLLHVLERPVERGLGRGDRADRDREPLLGEVGDQVGEALALVAKQVLGRDGDLVEEQLGRVLGVHADLLQVPAPLEAVHPALDHHQ